MKPRLRSDGNFTLWRVLQAIRQPKPDNSTGTLNHAGSIIGATRPKEQSPTDQVTSVWCFCRA